ncbi:MAG: hypothetical protein IJ877_02335 [Candidatus Gastranaerophilales bacterium]|nr:hypothetical protein [Candidatus Gastranaerophilales bacterium]
MDDKIISIAGIEFCYNKINGMFLFLADLVLFLFNLNSKNSIRNMQKLFYPLSVLLLIAVNLAVIADNIFILFLILFITFLINYILNRSEKTFSYDCIILFISFALISYGLLRYFVLNDISATFSNIAQYQYRVDDFIVNIGFLGFLILIFRLFNFLPFDLKAQNSHIFGFSTIIYLIVGCDLLIKTFILFNYYFYKSQSIIALYLILNLVYFVLSQFKSKGLNEFLKLSLCANIIIGIFGLFLYNESGFISFIYYSISLILTYAAGFLLSDIIEKKMHSDKFSMLKKITHNDRLIKFFIFIIFLNIAHIPPCVAFCASIYTFLNIFLIDMQGLIMTFAPYILFAAMFLLSLNALNVISKILIEPIRPLKSFMISQRQKFILSVISFALLISGLGIQYIMSQFMNIVSVGNM